MSDAETLAFSLDVADDEPLVLYGPPESLWGSLRVQNQSGEGQRLGALAVELPGVRGVTGEPVHALEAAARVRPHEKVRVELALRIDPLTPPGSYEGTLRIGARTQPLSVLVSERVDVRIVPDELAFYSEAELHFERELVLESRSNVAVRVAERHRARLLDSLEFPSAVTARAETGAESAQLLLEALAALRDDAGERWIEWQHAPLELAPGARRVVPSRFVLGEGLAPFRHYAANLELYHGALRVAVETGALPASRAREPSRERAGRRPHARSER
jgi:hypothetical protein